jgi:hypothetical protein
MRGSSAVMVGELLTIHGPAEGRLKESISRGMCWCRAATMHGAALFLFYFFLVDWVDKGLYIIVRYKGNFTPI